MKGELALEKLHRDGKVVIRMIVRGDVGDDGRTKLDRLSFRGVVDISNTRERYVTTPAELDEIRRILVEQGLV